MCEKYNGWTNYAPWRVALEITSDYLDSLAQDVDCGGPTFDTTIDLADHLSEYVDEIIESFNEEQHSRTGAASLAVDYARAFLSDVNWHELAHTAFDDYPNLHAQPESDEGGGAFKGPARTVRAPAR